MKNATSGLTANTPPTWSGSSGPRSTEDSAKWRSLHADGRADNPLPRLVEIEQFWNGKPGRRVRFEMRDATTTSRPIPVRGPWPGSTCRSGHPLSMSALAVESATGTAPACRSNCRIPRPEPAYHSPARCRQAALCRGKGSEIAACPRRGCVDHCEYAPRAPTLKKRATSSFANTSKTRGSAPCAASSKIAAKRLCGCCTVLERNPHRLPRAYASFRTGLYLKQKLGCLPASAMQTGRCNPREATELFGRVAYEAADVVDQGRENWGQVAKRQLDELQRLQVGMAAPDIEGRDADGKAFQLSDYRGQVVLLSFKLVRAVRLDVSAKTGVRQTLFRQASPFSTSTPTKSSRRCENRYKQEPSPGAVGGTGRAARSVKAGT